MLTKSDSNLIWLDCEMTGLYPDGQFDKPQSTPDRLLEIAVVVTDAELSVRVESPVWVLHQSEEQLAKMDAWNQATHKKSGLLDKVRASSTTEHQAEEALLDFLRRFANHGKVPMCGNTIGQDRRFLARYMPRLEAFFHYRNVDVSTLKELCLRWQPQIAKGFVKQQKHTALADVHESIAELIYYRQNFLHPQPAPQPRLS